MRIPIADNQVARQPAGTFNVPNLTSPPPGAFGTGVAEAEKGLGGAVQGLGTELADHIAKRMQQDQYAQVIQADTDFRQKLQDVMYSTEKDPNNDNKPIGVFNRLRGDASGATIDYDARAKALMADSLSSLKNPLQQRELAQKMNETYGTYRRFVIHHEATQDDENRKDKYEANMAQQISDAGILSDPADLNRAIDNAHKDAYRQMRDYGFDAQTVIPQKLGDLSAKMVASSIKGVLEDDPDQAQKILDGVSDANLPGAQRGQLQKAIDVAQKQFKVTSEKAKYENFNGNEAEVAGDLANGKLTQLSLDAAKGHISDDFYQLASRALKNVGVSEGTDAQKSSKATTLLSEFSRINDGDNDTRTKQMINFRKHVLAESTKLAPDQFSGLLAMSDPNFVKQITPEKVGVFQGALNYITDFYKKFNGGDASKTLMSFIQTAAGAKAEDIPLLAQATVKREALRENPSLVGHADVANNLADQKSGIKQVYGQTTNLKPDQKIKTPTALTAKSGTIIKIKGKTYVVK